jgi:hypothetical protein
MAQINTCAGPLLVNVSMPIVGFVLGAILIAAVSGLTQSP